MSFSHWNCSSRILKHCGNKCLENVDHLAWSLKKDIISLISLTQSFTLEKFSLFLHELYEKTQINIKTWKRKMTGHRQRTEICKNIPESNEGTTSFREYNKLLPKFVQNISNVYWTRDVGSLKGWKLWSKLKHCSLCFDLYKFLDSTAAVIFTVQQNETALREDELWKTARYQEATFKRNRNTFLKEGP